MKALLDSFIFRPSAPVIPSNQLFSLVFSKITKERMYLLLTTSLMLPIRVYGTIKTNPK